MHTRYHQRECWSINDKMDVMKAAAKSDIRMNCVEHFYILLYEHHNILINEQCTEV
jgi:hypothetical protein